MYESHIKQIEDELTPFGFYDNGDTFEETQERIMEENRAPIERGQHNLTQDQIELLNF